MGMLLLLIALGDKPVLIAADREFDGAAWIAEATVLAVDERILVRVTSDPDAVIRGFDSMGVELELSPPTWGPDGCKADLAAVKGSLLFVVRKDGTIPFVGAPADGAYTLRSWCDYNAWGIYSTDKTFGESVPTDDCFDTFRVKAEALAKRHEKDRAPFLEAKAAFLAGREPDLTVDELARLVRALGADAPEERDAAAQALVERGRWSIGPLREAAAAARDPEVKTRIELVLRTHAMYAAAYDAAAREKR